MNARINKLLSFFEKFYEIIVLNTIFLIANCFFFQIFYAIDFKPTFFFLYFFVSLTLLPSIVALLRTTNSISHEEKVGILRTFLDEIKFTVKKEWWLWLLIPAFFFLTITNLYVLQVSNLITTFLYLSNFIFVIAQVLFVVNLMRESFFNHSKVLLKESTVSFLPYLFKNLVVVSFNVILVTMALQISFLSIIVVFGLIIKINSTITERKRGIYYGISSKSKY